MSPDAKGPYELTGLNDDELALLEELFLDAGTPMQDLEPPKGTDATAKLQKAIWESWWVQLIAWVELGQVSKAADAVRVLIDLEAKWQANES